MCFSITNIIEGRALIWLKKIKLDIFQVTILKRQKL